MVRVSFSTRVTLRSPEEHDSGFYIMLVVALVVLIFNMIIIPVITIMPLLT